MLNVTQQTINAWNDETQARQVRVFFPSLNISITSEQVYQEALEVSEAICDAESLEFVGCIAHSLTVKISGLDNKYKGEKIKVFLQAGNTEEIPVFTGTVESVTSEGNKTFKKLIAYDELYRAGNVDVSAWYNGLTFPITLGAFRRSLFEYIGLEAEEITLPNDAVTIQKKYNPKSMQALGVLRSICQINGCCGIMNRDGVFVYRYINTGTAQEGLFPSLLTFPGPRTFPASKRGGASSTLFAYYRNCQYEEYEVKEIKRVMIRQTDDSEGTAVGTGTNTYIVQGNIFTYEQPAPVLAQIATNILAKIKDVTFRPFNAKVSGAPYLEAGDQVRLATAQGVLTFLILGRKLEGIQATKDGFYAEGTEEQKEFLSDVTMSLDLLEQKVQGLTMQAFNFDARITALEQGGAGVNVRSVPSYDDIPQPPEPNTIYLVQGVVVVK